MDAVTVGQLEQIEAALARRMIEVLALDTHALILDMTNFATFIDSGNERAPIAQRGKAKQKRYDLRIVGLGLVATRDGGIPLLSGPTLGPGGSICVRPGLISDQRGNLAMAGPDRLPRAHQNGVVRSHAHSPKSWGITNPAVRATHPA